MSTTIDQRVVEMRFDNKQFESNVSTTMSTLDKLKQKLNFAGVSKGMEDIDAAAKKCDMSALGNAVETVRAKFSAMEVIGVTALANITNSAVNAGKRIVSALTIDPIKTGFSEYETKINAIQTIMSNTASKGTTMEDVTRVIGELNTYADKTIYNFAEMTRNIGTFTAAGVGLEDSAAAIQGIANLAAASGSTSQQASTAMYQLSQALSSGTVKLMDWNSVVNAGMGGEKFQEALKATARDHGVAVDDIIKKNGSFRDSLQDGWLSADILNETLRKFTVEGAKEYAKSMVESGKYTQEQADALIKEAQSMEDAATKVKTFTQLWDTMKESVQSGWSQTWEILIGDFEEAKETLTKFSDIFGEIIGASADARNNLLQGWKDAGGRADLIDSLFNIFEGVRSIVAPIKEAFREIFPPMTVKQLTSFTEGLKNLTAKLKISESTSDKLKRTFKGVFAVLDIGKQAFSAIFKGVASLFGGVGKLSGGLLGVTASFGDWLVKLNETIKKSNVFNKIIQSTVKVVTTVATAIGKFVNIIKEKILFPGWEAFHSFLERIMDRMSGIGKAAGDMKSGVTTAVDSMGSALEQCSFFKLMQSLWKGVKIIGSGLAKAFGSLIGGIADAIGNGNFESAMDFFNSIISGGIGIALIKFLKSVTEPFEGLSDMFDGITGILDGVRGCFEAYQTQLKANALLKIAGAIAILAVSILVIASIDSEKLNTSLGAVAMLFGELLASMAIFTKISGKFNGVTKACTAMISISIAVLILASALKKISGLEVGEMATGLVGVAGLMAIVVAAAKVLGSGGKTIIKGAAQRVIFALAIKILATVWKDVSSLGWEELAKGLVGVGVLLAEVSLFMNTAKFSGKSITTATGIVILAAAIKILASACYDFGIMNWSEIGKGLAAIGALLAEVAIFTKLTGNAKHVISTGISLIAIAAAMKIFASAVQDLAYMSWEEIGKGLTAMAGSLAAVTIALNLMPKNMVSNGVGLIAISTALLIMSSALDKMGSMSWSGVAKGLITLGGAMLILAMGLNAMKGTLGASVALQVAATALAILTPVLAILGAMSWKSIAKGLVTIAGAFTILGIAGLVLKPLIPAILGLAGAFALIGASILIAGVGLLAAGAGLSALAVGIAAVATSLAAGATAIVSAITVIILGIIELIPAIIVKIGEGLIAVCDVIAAGAPAVGRAFKALVLSAVDVLVECVPVIADAALKLIAGLLDSLVSYTPQIVDSLFKFIIGVLDGIARNLPALIQSAVNIIAAFFSGVIDALGNMDAGSMIQGIVAVGLMAGLMAALAAVSAMIPAAMVGVVGMGLVVAELALVFAAIGALAQIPGLQWLVSEGGNFLQTIGTAIGQFVGGIIGGIAQGITGSLPQLATDLSTFMTNIQPFIDGAKSFDASAMEGVNALVKTILALTGANILDGIASWLTGGSDIVSFGQKIAAFGPCIAAYADSIKGVDSEAVAASASAAQALAEMTSYIPNEGGMVAWFTGENSVSKFGNDLVALGIGLSAYSNSIVGFNAEAVIASANAAKALADMTACIPNEGGMVSWFTGENSVSKFGADLVLLGTGLKGFSDAIVGVNPEAMLAAANAAKALADMTASIPNEGGMVAWFSGENSVSKFSTDLVTLGHGLKGFSDAIVGVNPEALSAAANAAASLAAMTASIPNEGGMVAWFSGEKSVSKFSADLVTLGEGLKGFSDVITGVNPEALTAAANAAKSLAEMTSYIPNEGGMVSWFTGENSVAKFANKLPALGEGLKGFSDAVNGINPEVLTSAANAAKSLAEMTKSVPKEGGIKAWFTGETSVAKFADKLPTLGKGLKGFSDSVAGINPESLTAAANAAKALAEMTDTTPKDSSKIVSFGDNLNKFGGKIASYFKQTSGITQGAIDASTKAIKSFDAFSSFDSSKVSSASKAIDKLVKTLKGMSGITSETTAGFSKALSNLGKTNVDSFVKAFKDIDSKMSKIGKSAVDSFVKAVNNAKSTVSKAGETMATKFIDGIKKQETKVKNAFSKIVKGCATAISNNSKTFYTAGANLAKGFANGISSNAYLAKAKAKAMAAAAAAAAKKELDEHSPSRVFYKIGDYAGQGFVNALESYSLASYTAGSEMANSARNGLNEAISRIKDVIDSDMDVQPTIRPVLDLSNVRSGVNSIGSMFGKSSVGVLSNIGTINSMMNRRVQNGENGDVVSAINKLRKDIGDMERTSYNINGLTYNNDSNIAEAVETIIRAAKVERRI